MSWSHGDYGGRTGAAWSGDKSLLHTACHVLQRCWTILRPPWPLHLLCCNSEQKARQTLAAAGATGPGGGDEEEAEEEHHQMV